MKIFIDNIFNCHYEIVYNVLHNYNEIIKCDKSDVDMLYVRLLHHKNTDFIHLIKTQFNNVMFETPVEYDYCINCTIYNPIKPINKKQPIHEDDKHFYISHEVFDTLNKHVYFVTPLNNNNYLKCDTLPFMNERVNCSMPLYVIQGSIDCNRRNYNMLETILSASYKHDFRIKILGSANICQLEQFTDRFNKYNDKLIIKTNLEFTNFHKEFLDCYCLLPLTSKLETPQYYTNKLTSSINYINAYKLVALIDKDLQDIYNVPHAYVYNNETDIVDAFTKSLDSFYAKDDN